MSDACDESPPPRFILRPPVSEDEVDAVEPIVRSSILEAARILDEEGADAFRERYGGGGGGGAPASTPNSSADADEVENDLSEDAVIRGDPRPYQIALLEHAKRSNSIIHLGTGQGKTLIALKLIDEYAHELDGAMDDAVDCHHEAATRKKQTWFLVPSVALAVQHTETIRANLSSLTVETACHTASNSEESRRRLSASDVMVATHGAALDLLRAYGDIFNMERVNLIVMDECHNCTGKHGYAQTMKSFYHRISDRRRRPRILGLTASPLINIKKRLTDEVLTKNFGELESIMDARIVSYASLDDAEGSRMKAVAQDLSEYIVEYDSSMPTFARLPPFDNLGLHLSSRESELNRLHMLYRELGPRCTGEYCNVLVRELSRNRFEGECSEEFDRLLSYLRSLSILCEERSINNDYDGKSNKLRVLEKLLEERFLHNSLDEHIGVLFVERRDTAVALHNYLTRRRLDGSAAYIRSDMLVRDASKVFKYTNAKHKLSPAEQEQLDRKGEEEWLHRVRRIKDVLEGLRRSGGTNLLIATSVVEEGIDVSACSFTAVFDNIKTTKGYIQMRGRARQQRAVFYCFQDANPGGTPPPVSLEKARDVEAGIEKYLRHRERNILPSRVPPFDVPTCTTSESTESEALLRGEYSTSLARVDLDSSKSLVNRYFMSVPMDDAARSSKQRLRAIMPIYNDESASLILPSHLPVHVRYIQLPMQYRDEGKKKIQSLLALVACVRLHKLGLVSDRLLPLGRDDLHKKLIKVALPPIPVIEPCKRSALTPPATGNEPTRMCLHRLEQVGEIFGQHDEALGGSGRKLGIVSLEPLPLFHMSLEHKVFGVVTASITEHVGVCISASEWCLSKHFFAVVMNARWRRRTSHTHFDHCGSVLTKYVLVALTSNNDIDWKRMEVVCSEYKRTESERIDAAAKSLTSKCPRLLSPRYDPNVTYICHGLSSKTCAEPFPNQEYSSYTDYMVKKRSFRVDPSCLLFNVQQLWTLPRKLKRIGGKIHFQCTGTDLKLRTVLEEDCIEFENFTLCRGLRTAYLPRAACMEAPLADAALYLHLVLMPQILYHLEQKVTVDAFVQHSIKISPVLGACLKQIKSDTILEVLVAKSCAIDDLTYDRLEWLGDAVLKVLHTDALIHSPALKNWTHYLHEGDLSQLRSAMGSNERLKDVAQGCTIDQFILTRPLSRGEWAPASMSLRSDDDSADVAQDIESKYLPSNKVMADVVEAIIGLIYVHCGFEMARDVAVDMGLTLSVDTGRNELPVENCLKSSSRLSRRAASFLGRPIGENKLAPSLLVEATTHASCLHHETPSYQKLEWIGDSALSLVVREHCFKAFPMLKVASLVMFEATIVSNEALAYLLCRSKMQDLIRHSDSTLPSRIESFVSSLERRDWSPWSSDPPKVLADVTEALIGAVHLDLGFESGQRSALHIISPILDAISHASSATKAAMMHPKQVLYESIGQSIRIRTMSEHKYALLYSASKTVWKRGVLTEANAKGNDIVCFICCSGATILAVAEHSKDVARNRACALLASVLRRPANHDLIDSIGKI